MLRVVSSTLQTKLDAVVTEPGYLIKVDFSTVLRYSSRGNITYSGNLFIGSDVMVSGLSWNSQGIQQGSVKIGNTDLAFGAIAFVEGFSDRPVTIWQFYEGAVGASDVVELFSGVGTGECEITEREVSFSVISQSSRTKFSPRRYMTRENGFAENTPIGTRIPWGNEIYIIEGRIG